MRNTLLERKTKQLRKYTMIGVLTLAASLVACSGQDKTASVPETSYSENTEAVDRIPESNTDTPEKSTEAPNQIPESNTDTPEESIESTETGSETSEMNTAPSSNAGEQEPKAIDAKPLFEAAAANGEEKIIIPEYAYYEADRIVLYIEKGAVVPQDMILRVQEIMAAEEKLWQMSFDPTPFCETTGLLEFFFGDAFDGIGYREDKVNLLILHDEHDGALECAEINELLLFDESFDSQQNSPETVYHEFGHVLREHQSPCLGQILEEGVGVYTQWQMSKHFQTPCWGMLQYLGSNNELSLFDSAALQADPEKMFREVNLAPRSQEQFHYQYGIRLVTFLQEEYGNDAIKRISEEAAKKTFSEEDNDTIIAILKSATSEDVFERFAAWEQTGWPKHEEEIVESLRPYGY